MTPPINTPLRLTLHSGEVVDGRYVGGEWFEVLRGGWRVRINTPASWCRLEDAHGTQPQWVADELQKAKET